MKKWIHALGLISCFVLCNACTEPEIAKVLHSYCNFKVDECQMQSAGTSHYSNKSSCERHHKDMLNDASSGKGSKCSAEAEDFFIQVMESQMAGGCDYSFNQTIMEEETRDILMAMASCFKDNDSDVSDKIPKLVDQIYDDGPEKTQAMTVVTLMMSGMQSGEH